MERATHEVHAEFEALYANEPPKFNFRERQTIQQSVTAV